jgi:hypothetical protein
LNLSVLYSSMKSIDIAAAFRKNTVWHFDNFLKNWNRLEPVHKM